MRIAVVGAGVVGLAAAHELIQAGHEVRCFDSGEPMAARSSGGTRIFRLAHRAPALVDAARQAGRGWRDWSRAAGVPLVGSEGVVVSGDIEDTAAAMTAAGARCQVMHRPPPGLPAADPAGPFLLDPAGGAIQAAATGRLLLDSVGPYLHRATVTAVSAAGPDRVVPDAVGPVGTVGPDGVAPIDAVDPVAAVAPVGIDGVRGGGAEVALAGGGSWVCDSVVIAAGASTPRLAAQVGIEVPDTLVHHARFTFPLREPRATPPCWLDWAGGWQPGFSSYGHLAGPGLWAVGGHLPVGQTRWDLGREAVTEASRRIVTQYVTEHVTGAEPAIVDTVYCDVMLDLGDGILSARSGPVLAVWGNNLFKFAPLLARKLARSAVELSVPFPTPAATAPAGE
ncbi:MAG: FAD-dependent oxidoreductase [Catenulispora sp.]